MALITIHAVVHIPAHFRVAETGRVIVPMAGRALKDRVVGRIGMARRAHPPRVAVVLREPRVVERGAGPRGGVVAGGARGGEDRGRRLMNGTGRPVVIGRMTAITIGGRAGKYVVDVATRAGHREVRAR